MSGHGGTGVRPLEQGLVLDLRFSEGSGLIAHDVSVQRNHGVFGAGAAAPTWAVVDGWSVLDFDGDDDYLVCADDASMKPASTITLIVSVYIDVDLDTDDMDDYCQFLYCAGGAFIRYRPGSKRVSGFVGLTVAGNKFMNHTISESGWYEIVVTFDGENYIMYINSVVGASGSVAADTINYVSTNVYVGGIVSSNNFKGIIGEPHIYDVTLTAEDVALHYAQRRRM